MERMTEEQAMALRWPSGVVPVDARFGGGHG